VTDRDIALETLRIARLTYMTTAANWGVNLDILEHTKRNLAAMERLTAGQSEVAEVLKDILAELKKKGGE